MNNELVSLIEAQELDRFQVVIDARTRHADLWPLVRKCGGNVALAKKLGIRNTVLGMWVNLQRVPNPAIYAEALEILHTITGKSFDELWPQALRNAIESGVAARRAAIEITSSMNELGEHQRQRLTLEAPQDLLERTERNELLHEALAQLPSREMLILKARYFDELSLAQIGEKFHISSERVRQIETRAKRHLQENLTRLGANEEAAKDAPLDLESIASPEQNR